MSIDTHGTLKAMREKAIAVSPAARAEGHSGTGVPLARASAAYSPNARSSSASMTRKKIVADANHTRATASTRRAAPLRTRVTSTSRRARPATA